MALDEQDLEEFIARLHDDPQLRDRVRNVILADDFLALSDLMDKLTDRTGATTDRLTESMD